VATPRERAEKSLAAYESYKVKKKKKIKNKK
jgi:hypothetical protein